MIWTESDVQRVVGTPEGLSRDLLDRHCNYVRKVLRNDFDWWHCNEGYEGTGKSTGSIHTARRIAGDLFDVNEHVVYDAEELLRLIDDCPRYGSIILDEAGEAAFSREWNTEMNKAIVKGSQQMRDRNLNVIFNLPALELLDSALRRRFRTLVIYEAPQFVRGRSMWHAPSINRYGKNQNRSGTCISCTICGPCHRGCARTTWPSKPSGARSAWRDTWSRWSAQGRRTRTSTPRHR